ncbi:glycosyltransferase family 4 protein [Flavobacterium sp. LS1R49]|uniref:Glycosyltransferase family 4 protein n=1 Tax=Flavobacterium shii TaxID=2987687 RepID=A0A9X3C4D7_9FLAO|nr:glycosyltransferase family 4 protein [Flavobacterium shii]MCV9927434.1 glycosyltransferase family 4 protein [Flavobacterium shii]
MRVLVVITRGDTIGGAQTHVASISKKLIEDGHEVKVVFGGEIGPFAELLKFNNISYLNVLSFLNKFSAKNDLKAYREIKEIITNFQPELISLHSTKAGVLGRIIAKRVGLPVVLTVHGWSFSNGIPFYKRAVSAVIERSLSFMVDKYILVSFYDSNIAKKIKFKVSKLVVVHNGVEDFFVKSNEEKKQDSTLSIVMVARFDNQKNQKLLIDVCKDISGIEISFIGDGPLLEDIKLYSNNLNTLCQINFLGLRLDVKKLIKDFDVFALISNWEGFPISTIEAMCIGMPIIVSDVGGAAECVEENVNGYIVRNDDKEYLRNAIIELRDNKSLLQTYGINSREIFLKKFTDQVMYDKTKLIFKSVLNNK